MRNACCAMVASQGGLESVKGMAVNCYTHQDMVAVAACSAGCGRALCGQCAVCYDPPTCAACAAKLGRVLHTGILDQSDKPLDNGQKNSHSLKKCD